MRPRPSKWAWESAPRIAMRNDWPLHSKTAPSRATLQAKPAPRATYREPCDSNASGSAACAARHKTTNGQIGRIGGSPKAGTREPLREFYHGGYFGDGVSRLCMQTRVIQ